MIEPRVDNLAASTARTKALSSAPRRKLSREELAHIEIGHTDIRPGVAWAATILFLLTIVAVPAAQHVYEIRQAFNDNPAASWSRPSTILPRCYDIFGSLSRTWDAISRSGPDAGDSLLNRVRLANNRVLLRDITEYTDALKEDSLLSDVLLPSVQRAMAANFGVGTERAYVGRNGWLFYRPDVDYIIMPGFLDPRWTRRRANGVKDWADPVAIDPVPAIADFAAQLERRGIRLVLLPTPVKPMIQPEKLSRRFDRSRAAIQNASYPRFLQRLRAAAPHIVVYDPTDDMLAAKHAGADPTDLYLRTDTHWTPDAMDLVAQELSKRALNVLSSPSPSTAAVGSSNSSDSSRAPFLSLPTQVANSGDVAGMLQPRCRTAPVRDFYQALGADWALHSDANDVFPRQSVTIHRVLDARGNAWKADPAADVLLLGDSFSNIFSSLDMGWGSSAGLAERLSFHLRRPIDAIVRNDAGAHATRRMLADHLRAGRDRLANKKVVIWQFAMRELASGDWQMIEMKHVPATPNATPTSKTAATGVSKVLELKPNEVVEVTGAIAALRRSPRPGTVTYKDHIMPLHLTGVRTADGAVAGAEAVVLVWGMRDNQGMPAARLQQGQAVTLRIRPWADVEEKYKTINSYELDDVDITIPRFWCEELK